jgi:hypothetical protein
MHWLHLLRAHSLLGFGGLSLVMLGGAAVLYYGGSLGAPLAVTQKISFVLCTAWLLLAHGSLSQNDAARLDKA